MPVRLKHRIVTEMSRTRYRWLTLVLAATLLLAPLLKDIDFYVRLIDVLLVIVMATIVKSTIKSHHMFVALLVTATLAGGLLVAYYVWPAQWLAVAFHIPVLVLLAAVAWVVLWDVLLTSRVTLDTINGAVCVYLLVGFFFAVVYSLSSTVDPGSFVEGREALPMRFHTDGFGHAVYFSFVTITTLGYGDIAPKADVVRSLAVMEALIGQFYLTVLVARLVGMHINFSGDRRQSMSPDPTHVDPGP